MTDKERIQAVLSENEDLNSVAFHCPDIQSMKRLVKALYELGFYWVPGTEYEDHVVEQRWNEKKKNTGVVIGNLKYNDPNVLWHGRVKMYENQGRKIIEVPGLFAAADANGNTNTEISNLREKGYDVKMFNLNEQKNSDSWTLQDTQMPPKCQNDTLDDTLGDTLDSSSEGKTPIAEEPTSATKKCPQCGNEMPVKAKFCNRCGHAFAKDEKAVTDDSVACVKSDENVSQKQNETENTKQSSDVVIKEPVAPVRPKNAQAEQSTVSNKKPPEVSLQDEPTVPDKENTPQQKEQPKAEKNEMDHLPLLCQLLGVKVNEPFCFVNATYFSNCVYRVNDKGLREVQVGSDFWLPCQNEGELVYMLQHPQNIKAVEQ